MVKSYLFYIIFILLGTQTIYGQRQEAYSEPKRYKLDSPFKGLKTRYPSYQYYMSTNLGTNAVSGIIQDQEGRIWFVMEQKGFGCIDGEYAYIYGSGNGFYDRMRSIVCDKRGRIWVGGNGVGTFCLTGQYSYTNYQKGEIFREHFGFDKADCSDVHINSIKVDSKGQVWVATGMGGLNCFKKDTTVWWFQENSMLTDGAIPSMVIDKNDRLWFLNDSNIYFIEDDLLHAFEPTSDGNLKFISLNLDDGGYVIAMDENINYHKITKEGIAPFPIEFPSGVIHDASYRMDSDNEGNLYMATFNSVYRIVDGEAINVLGLDEDLYVTDLMFDDEDGLWISTRTVGIIHIPSFDVLRFPRHKVWRSNGTLRIHQDEDYLYTSYFDVNGKVGYDTLLPCSSNELNANRVFILTHGIYFEVDGKSYYVNNAGELEAEKAQLYSRFKGGISYYGVNLFCDESDFLVIQKEDELLEKTPLKYDANWGIGQFSLVKKKGEKLFFNDLIRDGKYHYISYENGVIDTIIPNVLSDTLKNKIMGVHYVDDTTVLAATWGDFFFEVTPNTCFNFGRGSAGSNILYTAPWSDPHGNYWIGGIEGGANFVPAGSREVINLSEEDLFVGNYHTSSNGEEEVVVLGSDEGVMCYVMVDSTINVRTADDFRKKYRMIGYTNKDGLEGQSFVRVYYLPDQNAIQFINSSQKLHIVRMKEEEPKYPRHLRFETIELVSSGKKQGLFRWIPGRQYNEPNPIEMNYQDQLMVSFRSIFFTDYNHQSYSFRIDEGNWSDGQQSSEFRIAGLSSGEHTLFFRASSGEETNSEFIQLRVFVHGPIYEKAWFWIVCGLIFLSLVYLLFRWRTIVVRERARQLEETVQERTEEIELQKVEIEIQHGEIKDSMAYAKKIQEAILPNASKVNQLLSDNFILYEPKDIVAGDFYWIEETETHVIFAAADCTGHGVPGAMVSVVCHNALNRAVREFGEIRADKVLNKTRELVIETFQQSGSMVKDGMDVAICSVEKESLQMTFSGANNPLYVMREGELIEYKGDKQPVGIYYDPKPFTFQEIVLKKGDILYSFTDGFADQFGGPRGKKFKYKQFKELLKECATLPMPEQLTKLEQSFSTWKGALEQVDDVCVIGVRV